MIIDYQNKTKNPRRRMPVGAVLFIMAVVVVGAFIFYFFREKAMADIAGNYSKTSGDLLTASDWNNLDNDFLHVGNIAQQKQGALILNTGGSTNGLIVQSGNVGIGTTAPGALLDVAGSLLMSVDGGAFLSSAGTLYFQPVLTLTNSNQTLQVKPLGTGTISRLWLEGQVSTTVGTRSEWTQSGADTIIRNQHLGAGSNGNIYFQHDGTSDMTILSGGNVGIGTAAPGAKLQVGTPANTVGAMSTTMASYAGNLGATAGNAINVASFGFGPGNTVALGIRGYRTANGSSYITTAIGLGVDVDDTSFSVAKGLWFYKDTGNVGIGTSGPGARLSVIAPTGSPATTGTVQNGVFQAGGSTGGDGLDIGVLAGSPYSTWMQSGYLSDYSLAVYYPISLNPLGGNVGIGTLNPGTNKLQVNGKIQAIGGDICTDQGGGKCLSAAGGGFGAWQTKTSGTVYQAGTDGFAVGWGAANDGQNTVIGYSDSSNPPATIRIRSGVNISGASQMPIMFPVRKGDYWKVTGCTTVYWMPLGI